MIGNILKPDLQGIKKCPIYGAEWAGTSDPSWTRTDAAANFSDPNPYYASMSGSPSSPFDNIMPWKGLKRVTDSVTGELVEIPKFYYKQTRDGAKMKLQISMTQHDGFYTSPAHANRGDGVGERDYVYVSRYHCASDYKSKTSNSIKAYISINDAYTGIHNLGTNIWELDIATLWTIRMLYLVEFANWDIHTKIGMTWGGSPVNTGYTDSMPYHTGTMKQDRTTNGAGAQYRYMEGLFDNYQYFVNGLSQYGNSIYVCNNPANQNDTSKYIYIGNGISTGTSHLTISSYNISNVSGYEYILIPTAYSGNSNNYTCTNIVASGNQSYSAYVSGENQTGGSRYNIFCWDTWMYRSGDTRNNIGARLMVLPSSRLAA